MLRAFSYSLAGHLTLAFAVLLLSTAVRQPLRTLEIPRPVRLITSLELPAAPAAPRAAPRVPPPPAREAPPAPTPAPPPARAPQPARPAVEPPATPAPIAAPPKIVIPTRETPAATPPPAPPAPPRPDLKTRLAQRLASVPKAEPKAAAPPVAAEPRLASLPAPETAARPRVARPAAPEPALAGGGPVQTVGSFPHAWYLAIVKEKVFSRWAIPSEFALERRSLTTLVAFRIDRAGKLSQIALRQGSGYSRFDRSAVAAVQSMQDAPLLPEDYREEYLDVVIRFQNQQ